MSESAENLLPCPFCGGEARLYHDTSSDYERHWDFHVECTKCEAETQHSKARGYAIEFWNARAEADAVVKVRMELDGERKAKELALAGLESLSELYSSLKHELRNLDKDKP